MDIATRISHKKELPGGTDYEACLEDVGPHFIMADQAEQPNQAEQPAKTEQSEVPSPRNEESSTAIEAAAEIEEPIEPETAENDDGDTKMEEPEEELTETKAETSTEKKDDDISPDTLFEEAQEIDVSVPDAKDKTAFAPLLEQRDISLKALLTAMDEYAPIIPDAVTDYYLARAGLETSDVRIKRLLALATQKFVSDITTDAFQLSRIRAQSGAGAAGSRAGGRTGQAGNSGKISLTMEDLSSVLTEYGINSRRPDFYR